MAGERELDVVVYGATGFVGALTADHLAAHAPPGLRIALAGRSGRGCAPSAPGCRRGPRLAPRSRPTAPTPRRSRRWRRGTTVVVTTVGPYRPPRSPARGGLRDAPAPTTPTSPARSCSSARRSTAPTPSPRDRRADRALVRLRLDPVGPGGPPADEGRARRGRGRADRRRRWSPPLRGGFSGGTLASMRGQLDAMRSDAVLAPPGGRPVRAEPGPRRRARHAATAATCARCRAPPRPAGSRRS